MAVPRRSTAPAASSSSGFADVSELEKYKHVDNIGKGSFGVISRVQRVEDGKEFALKQLDYSKMTDKDRKQILAEVAILESLKHRNIVQLIQKIKDPQNERIYIVMEYCTSGDLGTLIRKAQRTSQPINEDKIWNIFLQITSALHHCHCPNERQSQGRQMGGRLSSAPPDGPLSRTQVLHRDLKPENVFLSDEFVKLGDFGLSKDMGHNAFTSTYVGTPLYMPPEILMENRYDTKSDIWSLGCLVFEMCALTSPFAHAKTQDELIMMVKSGKLPQLPGHISKPLKDAIRAMLNLNATKRPSTGDLLNMDEMKLHKKLFMLQHQTSLFTQRKQEMQQYENQINVRGAALKERERDLMAREAAQAEREAMAQAYEQDLMRREAAILEKEASIQETQKRVAAAAESLRVQWDTLKEEKDRASERELMGIPGIPLDFGAQIPAASRPVLEERKTVPLPSTTRFQRQTLEDTPSKIPYASNASPPSLGLGQPSHRSITPLRRNVAKSLGNLRSQARLDAEREALRAMQMGFGESTPARQLQERLQRTSIGSPSELDNVRYTDDVSMASPAPSVLLSPIVRPRRSSTAPTAAWLQSKSANGASSSETGSSQASGPSSNRDTLPSIPPTMIPAPTFVYRPEATPAKWAQDDPDLPSPFIRRTSTAPLPLPSNSSQSRDHQRAPLGSINVQPTATSAPASINGGGTSQPLKKPGMPKSKSSNLNLHQHVLRANATAQAQAQAQHAAQAMGADGMPLGAGNKGTRISGDGAGAAGSTIRSRSTLAAR